MRLQQRNSLKHLTKPKEGSIEKEMTQLNDSLLNFGEVCEEVANELTRGISSCRKSVILMRKEQSELAKQRSDLSEMLDLTQRDFEIAVKHTKNLIQKERDQSQK